MRGNPQKVPSCENANSLERKAQSEHVFTESPFVKTSERDYSPKPAIESNAVVVQGGQATYPSVEHGIVINMVLVSQARNLQDWCKS